MTLEHHLVLNRWLLHQLGADDLDSLKDDFRALPPDPTGESPFLRVLLEREGLRVPEVALRAYDGRIRDYEARLAAARGGFAWKYFQYLALLHVEILLDTATENPATLRHSLNGHLAGLRTRNPHFEGVPEFAPEDLRRLALFMATGSGKTLLLHANLWQVHHYLEHGRHPEALVRRTDGRRDFDNVVLVTPREGLSEQHLNEFRRSGIHAVHLAYEEPGGWLFGPQVRVIEVSKLRPEADVSGDGLSVALESLGGRNLVFVDEGHKGVGAAAREWKNRQQALGADGLIIEYSATFAQSVATAGRRARPGLLAEYGKSIVFDYSYRHFYHDGYGKQFDILNLESDESEHADDLLVGGLLTFYQQMHVFDAQRDELHPFNIERPLWVFLGAGVVKTGRRDLSDVATVVAFLRRFLEEPEWALERIRQTLKGRSRFQAEGRDLFAPRVTRLAESEPAAVYDAILDDLFHGRGALEVWEIKRAEGELGLRVSGPGEGGPRYFGVVNVGDPGALRRHLEREAGFDVQADEFTDSLFPAVDADDSPINLLIGSRKFIEGWSSWRVSSMGLLNMGRSEGPQVIQLFGRGIRLKGRNWTLQRSTGRGLPEDDLPDGLKHVETLYVTGWNADYIQAFRKTIEREDIGWELEVPVRNLFDPEPVLFVPQPVDGAGHSESWTLEPISIPVTVDLAATVVAYTGEEVERRAIGQPRRLAFEQPDVIGLLDLDELYLRLLDHKRRRGYDTVLIRPEVVPRILADVDVLVVEGEERDVERIREGAYRAATSYLDRYVALREREAESSRMQPVRLEVRDKVTRPYRVRGTDPELREQLLELIADRETLFADGQEPLPRLHVDRHLFTPLLLDPKLADLDLSLTPAGLNAGERRFVDHLMEFWDANHSTTDYRDTELFLLRNLPHSGVGFFRRSGFYPDFMLWVEEPESTLLQFVEPHGMAIGGIAANADKIAALKELDALSDEPVFREQGLRLSGYILTETQREGIPGADGLNWSEIRAEHRVLYQGDDYVKFLLGP